MQAPSVEEVAEATGGRYDVERVFAQGGMGTVYAARHRQLGSRLAIKVLSPDIATSAVRLARFKREAALAANLSHPNIVPVFEFDVQRGMAYLVMPMVEGESLASILARERRLDYPAVATLVREVGAALGFAHGRGVVHRDIKPGNILREASTGRWLITDFGVAHTTSHDDTDITQTGAVLGTPAYMSPEQASGLSDIDGRADLYALAAVAYEALTGQHPDPFGEPTRQAKALRRACPRLSRASVRVLTLPLALSRDRRPPSADAWLARFDSAGRRFSPLTLLAGGATLAAIGTAIWFALPDTASAPVDRTPTVAVLPFLVDDRAAPGGQPPLDSLLSQAFDWQLRYLPDHRVLGPNVRQHVIAREYGLGRAGLDTLLAVAQGLGATIAVAGRAVSRSRDEVSIQIQVHDAVTRRLVETADTTGSVNNLNELVAALVVSAFAEPVARAQSGWATSIPRGLEAFGAYWRGHQAFRRGAYPEAIEHFDEVIRLDSTFAPAHFKRVLAVMLNARPTQATSDIKAALDAASRYRAGLDPTSQLVLEGYEVLVRDGDLEQAEAIFLRALDRQPTAADAWFVLGYVQFFFRSLLGTSIGESRFAFEQALRTDSNFAAALLQLAAIAAIEKDAVAGREYLRRFLTLDNSSTLVELARMGDSLLYGNTAARIRVLGSVSERPTAVLELFSLAAGTLHPPPGTRPLAEAALLDLWTRARTQRDRSVAFRMRIAHLLATGRYASVDSLVRDAAALRFRDSELDRWIILTAITPVHDHADQAAQRRAVGRLEETADREPETQWLLARWYLQEGAPAATRAIGALRALARDSQTTSPHARSLESDIEAVQRLAAGDTAAALSLWDQATQRYSVELVPFGLTASLWSLRLMRADVSLKAGAPERTLEVAETFDEMAGFVDQVAWPHILALRGEAAQRVRQPALARTAYGDILALLEDANGAGVVLRENIRRRLAELDQ